LKAYVTLLSTDSYLDGVLALNESLKMTGASYPLVVVVSEEVSPLAREILTALKIEQVEVPSFHYSETLLRKNVRWGMPHWNKVSDKFRIFGLTQFEKIVYLDADMFVLKNLDHLFNWPHYSAAPDSPMIFEENKESHEQLNAGLIVWEPNKEIEQSLIDLSTNGVMQDQDTLRTYFPEWRVRQDLHLPQEYNIFFPYWEEYEKQGIRAENVYVLHFIGEKKPFTEIAPFQTKNRILFFWYNLYMRALLGAQASIRNLDFFTTS